MIRVTRELAVLVLVMGAGCAVTRRDIGGADDADATATHAAAGARPLTVDAPTAVSLGRCPFGHDGLRDVPVVYGLLVWTPELRRAADDLEFWPGGCVVGPWADMTRVVCPTCRYSYQPVYRGWERHVDNPGKLARPLSPLVAAFPVPAGTRASYSQMLRADGPVREGVTYDSTAEPAAAELTGVQYLRAAGLVTTRLVYEGDDYLSVTLDGRVAAGEFCLHLGHRPSVGGAGVSFTVTRADLFANGRGGP